MAAPPLLLLPVLANDARVWQPVMRALGRRLECSVVALTSADTMHALAANVLAHAPARFALAGLSMGGYCALEIQRQAPDRVLGIALVDASARPDSAESRANREKQIERAKTDYAGVDHARSTRSSPRASPARASSCSTRAGILRRWSGPTAWPTRTGIGSRL